MLMKFPTQPIHTGPLKNAPLPSYANIPHPSKQPPKKTPYMPCPISKGIKLSKHNKTPYILILIIIIIKKRKTAANMHTTPQLQPTRKT
jgi:hypothetical protein